MGIEGTHLNIIKARYDKSTANVLNNETLKAFSFQIKDKRKTPTLATFIQQSIESPSHDN